MVHTLVILPRAPQLISSDMTTHCTSVCNECFGAGDFFRLIHTARSFLHVCVFGARITSHREALSAPHCAVRRRRARHQPHYHEHASLLALALCLAVPIMSKSRKESINQLSRKSKDRQCRRQFVCKRVSRIDRVATRKGSLINDVTTRSSGTRSVQSRRKFMTSRGDATGGRGGRTSYSPLKTRRHFLTTPSKCGGDRLVMSRGIEIAEVNETWGRS